MDRLTYKSCMGDFGSAKIFDSEFEEKCALRNALGKYEELGYTADEIQEFMPKYPIGTYVYAIYNNRVFPLRVRAFAIEYGKKKYKLYINYNEERWSLWVDDWFDETDDRIFQTKDEAERSLAIAAD